MWLKGIVEVKFLHLEATEDRGAHNFIVIVIQVLFDREPSWHGNLVFLFLNDSFRNGIVYSDDGSAYHVILVKEAFVTVPNIEDYWHGSSEVTLAEFHDELLDLVEDRVVGVLTSDGSNLLVLLSALHFNVGIRGALLVSWRQTFALVDGCSHSEGGEPHSRLLLPLRLYLGIKDSIRGDIVNVESHGEHTSLHGIGHSSYGKIRLKLVPGVGGFQRRRSFVGLSGEAENRFSVEANLLVTVHQVHEQRGEVLELSEIGLELHTEPVVPPHVVAASDFASHFMLESTQFELKPILLGVWEANALSSLTDDEVLLIPLEDVGLLEAISVLFDRPHFEGRILVVNGKVLAEHPSSPVGSVHRVSPHLVGMLSTGVIWRTVEVDPLHLGVS